MKFSRLLKSILCGVLALSLVAGTGSEALAAVISYSSSWRQNANKKWEAYDDKGNQIKNGWVRDTSSGKEKWYLIGADGQMEEGPLVYDATTKSYYYIPQTHDGTFGSIVTESGTYDGIYITVNNTGNGSFGAITDPKAVKALTKKYGVKQVTLALQSQAPQLKVAGTNSNSGGSSGSSGGYFGSGSSRNSSSNSNQNNNGNNTNSNNTNSNQNNNGNNTNVTKYYSISYDVVDGTVDALEVSFPASKAYEEESLIQAVAGKPSASGYIFTGWFYDPEGSMAVKNADKLTSNITLYAGMAQALDTSADYVGQETLNYYSIVDMDPATDTFGICDSAGAPVEVEEGSLTLTNISQNNATMGFTIENGMVQVAYEPGQTYQATLNGDYRFKVPASDGFEVLESTITVLNMITKKKEVSSVEFAEGLKSVPLSQVSGMESAAFNGLVTADVKSGTSTANETSGTFTYDGAGIYVGDTVAVYQGKNPVARNLTDTGDDSGDVAYVKITAKSGNKYAYEMADVDDILALPDVFPIKEGTYTKLSTGKMQIEGNVMSAAMALTEQSDVSVDKGDFIALFSDTNTAISGYDADDKVIGYVKITGVSKSGEDYSITYEASDEAEVDSALDVYYSQDQQINLTAEEKQEITNALVEQAENSGFFEASGEYLAEVYEATEAIDGLSSEELAEGIMENAAPLFAAGSLSVSVDEDEKEFAEESTEETATEDKSARVIEAKSEETEITEEDDAQTDEEETSEAETMPKMAAAPKMTAAKASSAPVMETAAKPNVEVEIDKYNIISRLVNKQSDKLEGKVLHLEISVPFTVTIDDKVEIEVTATFIQEVKLDMNISTSKVKTGVLRRDYVLTASFDIGTYTGIDIEANVHGAGEESHSMDEDVDALLERWEKVTDSAEIIGNQLGGSSVDTSDGSTSALAETYSEFLANAEDTWIELFNKEIFEVKGDAFLHILSWKIGANFVVQANVNVSVGMKFEYMNQKRYVFSLQLKSRETTNQTIDVVESQYCFEFCVMGYIGIKAGVQLEIAVGLFDVSIDSVGIVAEVGAYLELWGLFYYRIDWKKSEGRTTKYYGAMYIEVGIYLDISFKAQLFSSDKLTWQPTLYSKKWPLWNAGQKFEVVGFATDTYTLWPVKKVQFKLPDDYFAMDVMDMTTGKISEIYSEDEELPEVKFFKPNNFIVSLSDTEHFFYDDSNNVVTVYPKDTDGKLETDVEVIWKGLILNSDSEIVSNTYHITWTNPDAVKCIELDFEGGEGEKGKSGIYAKAGQRITWPTPKKQGYVFDGWYTTEDCRLGTEFNPPSIMPEDFGVYGDELKLYAKWKPAEVGYRVELYFENPDGTFAKKGTSIYKRGITGDDTNVTEATVDNLYAPGYTRRPFSQEMIKPDGSTVVKVYYTANTYKVRFDMNVPEKCSDIGGTFTQYKRYGETVFAPRYELDGYDFAGWAAKDDSDIESGWAADALFICAARGYDTLFFENKYAKDISLKATWEAADNTVTYICNAATLDASRTEKVKTGEKANGYTFTVQNATFKGWALDKYGLNKIDLSAYDIMRDVTLYGIWEYATCDITLNSYVGEGGEYVAKHVTHVCDKDTTLYAPERRTGYTFDGWYESPEKADAGIDKKVRIPANTTKNVVLYARWIPRTDIEYRVIHKLEAADGTYASKEAETRNDGTAGGNNTYEGKDYEGYSVSDAELARIANLRISPDGSTEFEIKYDRNTYGVSYVISGDAHGKTAPAYRDLKYGLLVPLPEDYDDVEGYTFSGWRLEDGSYPPSLYTVPARNITLTGSYGPKQYQIRYDISSVEQLPLGAPTAHTYGNDTILPTLTHEGWVFKGWHVNGNTTQIRTKLNANEKFNGIISVKPVWEAVKCTINYKKADGFPIGDATTVDWGCAFILKDTAPAPTGYKADGWATEMNGKKVYELGQTISVKADTTFYAHIIPESTYTITYQLNGGSMPEGVTNPTYYDIETETFTLNNPAKPGYQFKGWQCAALSTPIQKEMTHKKGSSACDLNYVACWEANTYTIRVHDMTERTTRSFERTYGEDDGVGRKGILIEQIGVKKGYKLPAWSLTPEGEPEYTYAGEGYYGNQYRLYKNGKQVSCIDLTTENGATVDIYVIYTPIQYTIKFNKNYSSATGTMDAVTVNYDETYTLPECGFKCDGYVFDHWSYYYSTSSGGTEYTFANKGTVKNLRYVDGVTAELTAIWKRPKYQVKFRDMNGDAFSGKWDSNSFPATFTWAETFTAPTATKPGYTFDGWYETPNCTGSRKTSWNECKPSTVVDGVWTLYCKWVPLEQKVNVSPTGIIASNYYNVRYGTKCTIDANKASFNGAEYNSTNPYRDITFTAAREDTAQYHYEFDHWKFKNKDVTDGVYTFDYTNYSQYNLTAIFNTTVRRYTATIIGPDGDTVYKELLDYGTDIKSVLDEKKESFAKAGYTVKCDKTIGSTAPVTADVTYTFTITANTNTPYVVYHAKENLDGTYTRVSADTVNAAGTTDTRVKPAVKTYTGFDSPAAEELTVTGDGKASLEYKYTRKNYTVTYKPENGETSFTEIVKYEGKAEKPADPVKEKSIFQGWYNASGVKFDFDTVKVTTDLTLTAKWTNGYASYTVKTYKQALNSSGSPSYGTPETETLEGKIGEMTAVTKPAINGYALQAITQKTINANGSTVVSVYYDLAKYTVTLDLDTQSFTTRLSNDKVTYADKRYTSKVTVSHSAPSGYAVDHYVAADPEDGLSVAAAEELNEALRASSYSVSLTVPAGNVSLKAVWKDAPTIKITYDRGNLPLDSSYRSQMAYHYMNDKIVAKDFWNFTYWVEFEDFGYNLTGWSENADLSEPFTTEVLLEKTVTGPKTYYAIWEPKTYKIEYFEHTVGDNNWKAEYEDTYTYGTAKALRVPEEQEGYDFKYWHRWAGSRIDGITEKTYGNLKLCAKWEMKDNIPYTVRYLFDEGNGTYVSKAEHPEKNLTGKYSAKENYSVIAPAILGYGISSEEAARIKAIKLSEADMVIEVHYQRTSCDVIYRNTDQEKLIDTERLWVADAYTIKGKDDLKADIKAEYESLLGWSTDYRGTILQYEPGDQIILTKSNFSLYSYCKAEDETDYTITYDLNGGHYTGTGRNPIRYKYKAGDYEYEWVKPVKEGFVFAGWSKTPQDGNNTYESRLYLSGKKENLNYYACFEPLYTLNLKFPEGDTKTDKTISITRKDIDGYDSYKQYNLRNAVAPASGYVTTLTVGGKVYEVKYYGSEKRLFYDNQLATAFDISDKGGTFDVEVSYRKKGYQVTFVNSDNVKDKTNLTGVNKPTTAIHGEEFTYTNNVSVPGYYFYRFSYKDAYGSRLTFKDKVSEFKPYGNDGDKLVLTAEFKPYTIVLTYAKDGQYLSNSDILNKNDADGNEVKSIIQYYYNHPETEATYDEENYIAGYKGPVPDGKVFTGWYTEEGVRVGDGTSYASLITESNFDELLTHLDAYPTNKVSISPRFEDKALENASYTMDLLSVSSVDIDANNTDLGSVEEIIEENDNEEAPDNEGITEMLKQLPKLMMTCAAFDVTDNETIPESSETNEADEESKADGDTEETGYQIPIGLIETHEDTGTEKAEVVRKASDSDASYSKVKASPSDAKYAEPEEDDKDILREDIEIHFEGDVITIGTKTFKAVPREADEDYEYVFEGWSYDINDELGTVSVKANFAKRGINKESNDSGDVIASDDGANDDNDIITVASADDYGIVSMELPDEVEEDEILPDGVLICDVTMEDMDAEIEKDASDSEGILADASEDDDAPNQISVNGTELIINGQYYYARTKEAESGYENVFIGWSFVVNAITGKISVKANFGHRKLKEEIAAEDNTLSSASEEKIEIAIFDDALEEKTVSDANDLEEIVAPDDMEMTNEDNICHYPD